MPYVAHALVDDYSSRLAGLPNSEARVIGVAKTTQVSAEILTGLALQLRTRAGAAPSAQGYITFKAVLSQDGVTWPNGITPLTGTQDVAGLLNGAVRLGHRDASSAALVIHFDIEMLGIVSRAFEYVAIIAINSTGDALSATGTDHTANTRGYV